MRQVDDLMHAIAHVENESRRQLIVVRVETDEVALRGDVRQNLQWVLFQWIK